jgi:mannose-6-phosphate isomerase-like protein (cupin superfamily)
MEKVLKPWGYEIHWAKTDNYVGKLLFIKAGHRLSKQYHVEKEETVFVLKGTLYNYDENDNIMKFDPGEDRFIVSVPTKATLRLLR